MTPQETGDCWEDARHTFPAQQPAQEKKSQAPIGTHEPVEQELLSGHAEQAWPPLPHCEAFWPPNGTQRFPWQQPFGHVDGVHIAIV